MAVLISVYIRCCSDNIAGSMRSLFRGSLFSEIRCKKVHWQKQMAANFNARKIYSTVERLDGCEYSNITFERTHFTKNEVFHWGFIQSLWPNLQSWGFGHVYWRNPQWKTSFFVQWRIAGSIFFGNKYTTAERVTLLSMTVILSVTKTNTNNNKIKMKFIDYS